MRGIIIFCFIALCSAEDADFDYCTLNSMCRSGQHTLCTYKTDSLGRLCVNYENRLLTANEKQQLLDKHNELRAQVARGAVPYHPRALNVGALAWSEEDELIARRWALQCNYQHDKCRFLKDGTYVGQNLAIASTVGYRGVHLDQVQSWFDEHKLYVPDEKNLLPIEVKDVGHYTQLVWAKTTHVGCERTYFHSSRFRKFPASEYLVCVYSPGGNIIGSPVYQALGVNKESCVFTMLVSLFIALKLNLFTDRL